MSCGEARFSYNEDESIFERRRSKWLLCGFIAFLFFFPSLPGVDNYILNLSNLAGIAIIGAIGLNILTGFTGQISLGHGAFLGVGAYTSAILSQKLHFPFLLALPCAGGMTALLGLFFGIPSLRLKGLYLAIATLAAQFIIEFGIVHWDSLTNGPRGILVPAASIGPLVFDTDRRYYYLVLVVVILTTAFALNLFRTRVGRAFMAIRDRDISAEVIGVNLYRYKLYSFFVSSFVVGIAGSLWAHYIEIITNEHFGITVSISYLAMIIIGGLGSVLGSILGAIFIVLLPETLRLVAGELSASFPSIIAALASVREITFGAIIVLFLTFEPEGLAAIWRRVYNYWHLWPFSY